MAVTIGHVVYLAILFIDVLVHSLIYTKMKSTVYCTVFCLNDNILCEIKYNKNELDQDLHNYLYNTIYCHLAYTLHIQGIGLCTNL